MTPSILLLLSILLFLVVQFSLQEEGCGGPLKPKVVQSTAHSTDYPASNVLILGEEGEDEYLANGKANFWLAETRMTTGQGFTIKLDNCTSLIAGCQIRNRGDSRHKNTRLTKKFRVAGSVGEEGPWETLVEDQLVDTRGVAASLLNFTFEEPVMIQFLKFELLSYWGDVGGGLHYFAAIPAVIHGIDCNVALWTEWTGCCNSERKRRRTTIRNDHCKAVGEVEDCSGDYCPVDCEVSEWSDWSKCLMTRVDSLCKDCKVLIANRSRHVVADAKLGGNRCPDKLAEMKTCNVSLSAPEKRRFGDVSLHSVCEEKETLLFSAIGVLSLLLILQTVGVAVFIYKVKTTARKVIKKDVNPLYGVDYEGEEEDRNPRSSSLEHSYDYMGN